MVVCQGLIYTRQKTPATLHRHPSPTPTPLSQSFVVPVKSAAPAPTEGHPTPRPRLPLPSPSSAPKEKASAQAEALPSTNRDLADRRTGVVGACRHNAAIKREAKVNGDGVVGGDR